MSSSNATDMSKYTMALKEYVDKEGGDLEYSYALLSLDPSTWRCILDFEGLSVEETRRNKQEAKHAASQRTCSLLGLVVD